MIVCKLALGAHARLACKGVPRREGYSRLTARLHAGRVRAQCQLEFLQRDLLFQLSHTLQQSLVADLLRY
jgi:hypothetical protein